MRKPASGRVSRISPDPAAADRSMALKRVLRLGYIQIRVLDMDAAITYYVDRLGLHEGSREPDAAVVWRPE